MASRRRRICKENTPRIPPPSRVKIRFMPAKSVSLGRDLSRNLQQRYRRARTQQDLGVTATAASTPLLLSPECDAEAGALARWAAEVLEEATPATCRRFVRQRTEVVPEDGKREGTHRFLERESIPTVRQDGEEGWAKPRNKEAVAREGVEPPTRGFSVRCSTT